MTKEDGWEEEYEEKDAKALVEREGKEFKLWTDEKYYIDE
jgi:deoxyribodipyrimidine photo-lyase